MVINETIGRHIRAQREKLGFKQHDIANALQISPQAVSKWERGENAPDIALLVPLARLLGISTDTLLGYHAETPDVFDATVFFAIVEGYAAKSQSLSPKAIATWANGFFFQLTEAVLHHDGIPVKYMGDTFLGFFSGPHHQQRAIQSASRAKTIVSDPLTIALNSGEIYLGTIGHPDYSRPDIMGDTVNLAFMMMEWAIQHTESQFVVNSSLIPEFEKNAAFKTHHSIEFVELAYPVTVYEIVTTS